MRIATLIISLIVSLFLTIQSFAVMAAGGISSSLSESGADKKAAEDLSSAGAIGILVAILWVIAAAFVIAKPKVSVIIFGISGFLCIAGASSDFTDLRIYGFVAVAFALMSRFGIKEKANKDEQDRVRYQADLVVAAQALKSQG